MLEITRADSAFRQKGRQPLRFSGYRLTPSNEARLFLPGFNPVPGAKVEAEAILPGQNTSQPVPLTRWNDYWLSKNPLPLGTSYRFLVNGAPHLDGVEVTHPLKDQPFNRISPYEARSPQKSTVIADIYLDSLLSREQLDKLTHENAGILPMRNHFNLFGGNETGLFQALPHLKQAGFTSLLFKPFIGGDNLSSHRYWTVDPYVLNTSFTSKPAFQKFLRTTLTNDLKIFADGAFVNQGFNGVQKLANLAHGFRSPYWNWFAYNETPEGTGPLNYPKHTFEGDSWGILPVIEDKATGGFRVAHERYALRVVNDPVQPGYDKREYTFVETYDPTLETADGKPLKPEHVITTSRDSVRKLKIPVSAEEVRAKRNLLNRPASTMTELERAELCEWNRDRKDMGVVRLTADFKDDSGFKWDGQVDGMKMNMHNPEVVKYVQGALTYWTRYVMNTHVDSVTRALAQVKARYPQGQNLTAPQLLGLVQEITQKPGEAPTAQKILPPVTYPDLENLTREEVESAIASGDQCPPEETGKKLAGHVLQEYPLTALELPIMFKAALSHPGLSDSLQSGKQTFIGRLLSGLLSPLLKIPGLGKMFAALKDAVVPGSFENALARKLSETVNLLTPEAREKLRDGRIQSLVTEKLAESLYTKIFTGLDDTTGKSPEEIRKAFLDTIPQGIYRDDPETAAIKLPRFMRQRLAKIDIGALTRMLEKDLNGLDPKLAGLAEAIIEKREFGLNWRLDAAKDVSNTDVIRATAPQDRPEVFLKEIEFVRQFWKQLSDSIHGVYKKASIIAEFTDFFPFTGNHTPTIKEATDRLYKDTTFNGMVDWNYTYHQLHSLVHHDQRPDELGGNQYHPSEFLTGQVSMAGTQPGLDTMNQELPFPVLRQYQNISSCHDQITSSHGLLINPSLAFMDLYKWWGLKDDLNEICNEFKSKACFDEARKATGIPDVNATLGKLMAEVNADKFKDQLSDDLRSFFDAGIKGENKGEMGEPIATPSALKPRFIEEIFAKIPAAKLGLNAVQHEALKKALTARISEASESRAMRAVIVNAMLKLNWEEMPSNHKLAPEQQAAVQQSLWRAIDKTIGEWGRHFGYQPLDIALTRIFLNFAKDPALPEQAKGKAFQDALKSRIFTIANQPVMDKLLRIFAVQTAMPGNPSIYLQDLFARGGGEWLKNIFVQNRNLIPIHMLPADPKAAPQTPFQHFFHEAGQILRTRSALTDPASGLESKGFEPEEAMAIRRSCAQALNNGTMLMTIPSRPPEGKADPMFDRIKKNMDDAGVMPIVRDNGQDQVIVLVNTGMPKNRRDDYSDRVGTEADYKDIPLENPVARDHKPDLSYLKLAPGTRYIDVQTGEAFRLDAQGLLVSEQDPAKGVDVKFSRFLVRDNRSAQPHPDTLPQVAIEPPPKVRALS